MYDAEIILPLHLSGKYLERAHWVREYGVRGQAQNVLLTVLLSGNDQGEDWAEGWTAAPNLAVRVERCGAWHAAAKIYRWYQKPPVAARWHIRIDDDSLTDIDAMLQALDDNYDWQQPQLLMQVSGSGMAPYRAKMRELPFPKQPYYMAWEFCATSHSAYCTAFQDRRERELLRFAIEYAEREGRGYGDQILEIALQARGLKPIYLHDIHCRRCPQTAHESKELLKTFTAFGGEHWHVHFVAPDLAQSGQIAADWFNSQTPKTL